MKRKILIIVLALFSAFGGFAATKHIDVKQSVRYAYGGEFAPWDTFYIDDKLLAQNDGKICVRYDFTVLDSAPIGHNYEVDISFPRNLFYLEVMSASAVKDSWKLSRKFSRFYSDSDYWHNFFAVPGKKGSTASIEILIDFYGRFKADTVDSKGNQRKFKIQVEFECDVDGFTGVAKTSVANFLIFGIKDLPTIMAGDFSMDNRMFTFMW